MRGTFAAYDAVRANEADVALLANDAVKGTFAAYDAVTANEDVIA